MVWTSLKNSSDPGDRWYKRHPFPGQPDCTGEVNRCFPKHSDIPVWCVSPEDAGELRSETEPELLNDAIFGAVYSRFLLRSGPLTRRFGEELVEQVLRGHRLRPGRSRSD
jgi:hypothetical protein